MKKRSLLVVALAVLGAGAAFGQEDAGEVSAPPKKGLALSAGVGGLYATGNSMGVDTSIIGNTTKTRAPYSGFGGFGFFDATYAEVSVGFAASSGEMKEGEDGDGEKYSRMDLSFGLMAKYPLKKGEKLTLFPMAGVQYDLCLSTKDMGQEEGGGKAADLSAFWFKLGGGLDYALSEKLYLRAQALYGFRFANKAENDFADGMRERMTGLNAYLKSGGGITAKIAVGFNF